MLFTYLLYVLISARRNVLIKMITFYHCLHVMCQNEKKIKKRLKKKKTGKRKLKEVKKCQ